VREGEENNRKDLCGAAKDVLRDLCNDLIDVDWKEKNNSSPL